jgi:hypothetical protein
MFQQAKLYAALGASLVFIALLIGSGAVGYRIGSAHIQAAWDKEHIALGEGQLKASQEALTETRRLSEQAQEQSRKDLEAALRASEARQQERANQTLRDASLASKTRSGSYVSPECVLDPETFSMLQEQLK